MPIHPSAAVVLLRNPPNPDVYWVRRSDRQPYLGGFHAFPGGRVGRGDDRAPVHGAEGEDARNIAAAVRECFEESGVLLARGAEKMSPQDREAARRRLLAGEVSFPDLCAQAGLHIDAADLAPCGVWLTPEFSAIRFQAWYFLSWLPEGQQASILPGELNDGGWVRPREALVAWRNGRVFLAPPVLRTLEALASAASEGIGAQAALDRLHTGGIASPGPIEMTRGIRLVPMRTPTLPPATHTNCYVAGEDRLAIFDPGSAEPDELAHLDRTLEPLLGEGCRVEGIYLTHHHPDHWGGAAVLRDRFGVPVFAHPRRPREVPADAPIEQGQTIDLGSRRLRAVFTPGHASDHLAFLDEKSGVLLAGDLVAGTGTVIVDPPDGDMSEYFASLDRLLLLPVTALFPGHGPPMGGGRTRLKDYKEHRLERESRVLKALDAGASTVEALLPRVYDDVPAELHLYAARSLLAHLLKLEREGRARREGSDRWALAPK